MVNSPLRSGSVLNVLIGVLAMMLLGIISLLLSKLLMMVYLILISSIVPFVLIEPRNSTKSRSFIFLLVINMTPATIFSMVVCIANPILSEIHHMIKAVSKPMI